MSRRDSGPESNRSTSTSRALSVPATFSAVRNRHDTAFILRGSTPKSMPVATSRPAAPCVASPGPDPAQQREDRPHDRALGQPLILGELERLAAERLGLVGPALIVRDKAEQRERPDHGGTDRRGPADADRLLHRGLGLHLLAGEVEAVAERP